MRKRTVSPTVTGDVFGTISKTMRAGSGALKLYSVSSVTAAGAGGADGAAGVSACGAGGVVSPVGGGVTVASPVGAAAGGVWFSVAATAGAGCGVAESPLALDGGATAAKTACFKNAPGPKSGFCSPCAISATFSVTLETTFPHDTFDPVFQSPRRQTVCQHFAQKIREQAMPLALDFEFVGNLRF